MQYRRISFVYLLVFVGVASYLLIRFHKVSGRA